MNSIIVNSGEQFIPGVSSTRLADEHQARYIFALAYVKEKKVLDIACGTGYGSAKLAGVASSVIGVDISKESIAYAIEHYSGPKVSFLERSATDSDLFSAETFDVIVSFETIEHLDVVQRRLFLLNLHKWLKPNGILILSTPNKTVTSPFTRYPMNPHHVIEFSLTDLERELAPLFQASSVYGQRMVKRVFTKKLIRKGIRLIEKMLDREFHLYDLANGPDVQEFNSKRYEPRIQIALCVRKQIVV